MKPLITPADMRAMEQRYFRETGTASYDVMERAARALTDAIARRWGRTLRVFIACGPGGNGGDGYACARMLADLGAEAAVFRAAPPASPDAAKNCELALAMGIPVFDDPDTCPDIPDLWVDALYGTGLSRPPSGAAAGLIGRINADRAKGARVAAVDIPSGLDGLTGAAFAPCVQADATFTFQYVKPGCLLADGLDACGDLEALDIGIPAEYYPEHQPGLAEDADVRRFLPARRRNFHKGNGGHLLIIAGSFGMAGAAALCAGAALRTGTGLVTVACPGSIVPILQTLAPCAMCVPLPESDGAIAPEAAPLLEKLAQGKRAVACGCGLSLRAAPQAVRAVLECGLPAVLDADALNLIASDPDLRAALRPHHLITPHPGEAARLLGRRCASPLADVEALAALGCVSLLKGASSAVWMSERAAISASGCNGMAKGGSGDCLTGIAGALIAQAAARGESMTGDALAACALAASELHGIAGEIAQARRGAYGMNAGDIVDALPEALKRYGA